MSAVTLSIPVLIALQISVHVACMYVRQVSIIWMGQVLDLQVCWEDL